jgi:hypothetical protein
MVWDRNHISNLKKLIIFCVVMLVEWHMGVVVWWCDHKVTSAPWNNQLWKFYATYCHFAMLLWIVFFHYAKGREVKTFFCDTFTKLSYKVLPKIWGY